MIATRPHDSWDALRFIEDFLKSIWTTVSMSVPFLVLITSLNIIIEETDLLALPRRTKKSGTHDFLNNRSSLSKIGSNARLYNRMFGRDCLPPVRQSNLALVYYCLYRICYTSPSPIDNRM